MKSKLIYLLVAVFACGLIASGCGGDDEESTDDSPDTTTEATTDDDTGGETDATTTEEDSGDEGASIDSGAVYDACADLVADSPAKGQEETICGPIRDGLEQCADQAASVPEDNGARETAINACEQAAEQALEALQTAG